MPLFIASMAVSTLAYAVSRMTGMSGYIFWISRNNAMPSIGVMRKSVTVMSMPPARSTSKAAAPSRAVCTVKPFAFRRLCSSSTMRGSSSTMRIFAMRRILYNI